LQCGGLLSSFYARPLFLASGDFSPLTALAAFPPSPTSGASLLPIASNSGHTTPFFLRSPGPFFPFFFLPQHSPSGFPPSNPTPVPLFPLRILYADERNLSPFFYSATVFFGENRRLFCDPVDGTFLPYRLILLFC